MTSLDYLKILVDDIHSTVIATVDKDGKPVTRVIDIMLYDEEGIYFLTAKGKAFYDQLMEQEYVSLSSIKDQRAISLRGKVKNIGSNRLDEIFEADPYMKEIYPGDTRSALEVFHLYEATGEFFDISDPSHVERGSIEIGNPEQVQSGYFITDQCIACGQCYRVCPQKCIDRSQVPLVIDQNHCLHCGRCAENCPVGAVIKR